jgi:hypothetical protein
MPKNGGRRKRREDSDSDSGGEGDKEVGAALAQLKHVSGHVLRAGAGVPLNALDRGSSRAV